ncbi:MAG: sigma-70 family RNA polymerase sigma factor [Ruminococcus sp.]|nr:sigma-70 family RNA polymerase sigma factor [Ruminococcus sp.]
MPNNNPAASDLARVMKDYKQTVYGLALSQLKNKQDAEDIFQEVFLTYFRKAPQCDDEPALRCWLIRTTLNLCKRSNASIWNTRVEKREDAGEDTAVQFSSQTENDIWEAVMSLKEKYRVPVYLFYFEDMPVAEIARTLCIDEGAAKMRLSRARKTLKKRLEGEYFE